MLEDSYTYPNPVNSFSLFISFILMMLGYIYGADILGFSGPALFLYAGIVLFFLSSRSLLRHIAFSFYEIVCDISLLVFIILNWFLQRQFGFVEVFEIDKSYITTITLFLVATLLPKITERIDFSGLTKLYVNIVFINALIVLVEFVLMLFSIPVKVFPWQAFLERPSGIFMEPSYYGQFSILLPFISKDIFSKSRTKIFIIILSLISTFSLFCFLSLFLLVLRITFETTNTRNKLILISVLIVLVSFSLLIFIQDPVGISVNLPGLERVETFIALFSTKNQDLTQDLSTFYRVFSGLYVIRYESLDRLMLGYGPGDNGVIATNYKGRAYRHEITSWHFINGLSASILGFGLPLYIVLSLYLLSKVGLLRFLPLFLVTLVDAKSLAHPFFVFLFFVSVILKEQKFHFLAK